MAEYLLKGGKMLDKTCPSCGSPLFSVKGETMCVVCSKARKEQPAVAAPAKIKEPETVPEDYKEIEYLDNSSEISGDMRDELEKTIIHLCRRVRQESRPEDCLAIMECISIADGILKGR